MLLKERKTIKIESLKKGKNNDKNSIFRYRWNISYTKLSFISSCKKGIKKARENGHLIFLCTGRNRVGIENIMSDDFDGCICSAGGYLEIKGEMIETTYLDKEEVEQARKVLLSSK